MTTEQQRIAIAEACGWEKRNVVAPSGDDCGYFWSTKDDLEGKIVGKCASTDDQLPNYPNDLNAMHEAEKIISADSRYKYTKELIKVVSGNRNIDYGPDGEMECDEYPIICATSQQRAEAFLRTIGKWYD